MRFKGRIELEHGLKSFYIAPFINILFLLLIFIMLTSSFISQPGIALHLPRAVTSEAVQFGTIEILVSAENTVHFNGAAASTGELKALLAQAAKRKQTILLKVDTRASLGKVVEISDLARALGIQQVSIATNQEY